MEVWINPACSKCRIDGGGVNETQSAAAAGRSVTAEVHSAPTTGPSIVIRAVSATRPCWRSVAAAVVNDRPARMMSTSISAGPISVGRRKDAATVRTARSGKVASAARTRRAVQ